MEDTDRLRFYKALYSTSEMFARQISHGTIVGYYRFLSQYPIESIEKALVTHIETSDAFPTVHQLKELLDKAPTETA